MSLLSLILILILKSLYTPFQAAVDATVEAYAVGSRNKGGSNSTACNNWDYIGTCSFGDRCKFSHDTEAGCKGSN